jgi:D-alanyl-D-alanine carboxypeptidase/D-alanyl-D-alanine-endopeptidase (penicillin-binding protein 4)
VIRTAIALAAALVLFGCGMPKPVAVAPAPSVSSPSSTDRLQADLAAIFATPQFERSFWSVLVRPLSTSEDLYTLNASKLMMPGSAMKIVTASTAAALLGWDYQFETRVVSLVPVDGGVVRGDLIAIGGGDPSISERSDVPGTLRALARQVREAGVTRIEGGIIGDDDLFDDRGIGSGWTLDNLPYGYSAAVSALEYNEGSVDLVIRAGAEAGTPVAIQVRPEGGGLQVDNRLVTVAASGNGMLTLERQPGSSHLAVQGQIPAKAAPFVRTASVDNPTRFFAAAFRAALITEGVQVFGDAIDIDELETKSDLAGARVLVSHKSPPLRQLVSSMMKVSQNQYAEMLLRAMGTIGTPGLPAAVGAGGAKAALPGRSGEAAEAGARKAREVLQTWNIGEDSVVIADGSGLSRYNYVTSDALVRILQAMRSDPQHAAFFDSLPVAGRDGTLSRRLAGTPAEGKVRAKTGTVDNVRAIAGYVEAADGETLVFSMIANNFTMATSEVDAAADRALIRLAAFTRR